MTRNETRYDKTKRVVENVLEEIEHIPILEGHFKVGGEQMLPDSGGAMYFRHSRVYVEGDMNDMATLRVISRLCDEYDLVVDEEKGRELCSDNHAILRVE